MGQCRSVHGKVGGGKWENKLKRYTPFAGFFFFAIIRYTKDTSKVQRPVP